MAHRRRAGGRCNIFITLSFRVARPSKAGTMQLFLSSSSMHDCSVAYESSARSFPSCRSAELTLAAAPAEYLLELANIARVGHARSASRLADVAAFARPRLQRRGRGDNMPAAHRQGRPAAQ